jgi:hypothetical protein
VPLQMLLVKPQKWNIGAQIARCIWNIYDLILWIARCILKHVWYIIAAAVTVTWLTDKKCLQDGGLALHHRSEIFKPRLPGVLETFMIYYCCWIAQCILKHLWFNIVNCPVYFETCMIYYCCCCYSCLIDR